MNYGHWDNSLVGDFNPEEYFGFTYLIVNNVSGKKYIGKKQFKRFRKKGSIVQKNYWETYTSSCNELNNDIQLIGKDKFDFIITELFLSKGDLSYAEMEQQFKNNVIKAVDSFGNKLFYNRAIGNTPIKLVEWTPEKRAAARKRNLGKVQSKETIAKRVAKTKGKAAWNKGLTKENDPRIKNQGKSMAGEENPMYGKKRPGGTHLGKKAYNNGVRNIFAFECPEGFVEGFIRLKKE